MQKKNIYIALVVIIVLALIVIFSGEKKEGVSEESNLTEEVISEIDIKEELKNLPFIPEQDDEVSVEGLAVPVAQGIVEATGNNYRDFEVVIKDGKIDPSEFRVRLKDVIGFSLTNVDENSYELDFSIIPIEPAYTYKSSLAGSSQMIRVQLMEEGEFNLGCIGCPEGVIGKIIVFPEEK